MWTRLVALIKKELLVVLRDPKGRIVIIVPPLVQPMCATTMSAPASVIQRASSGLKT